VAALRVYASAEAHSSIDKACMTLGLGRSSVVRIATNDRFEMEPEGVKAQAGTGALWKVPLDAL